MSGHDRLRQRLRNQRHELRSAHYIELMAEQMQALLKQNAPVDTGTLVRNLTATSGIHETQDGYRTGFAPKSRVGQAFGAPRGTIAAFLNDYPQFREHGERKFRKDQAWQILPQVAKDLLQLKRQEGKYGGANSIAIGKSPYLYPQEGSFERWRNAAKGAGITPTEFIFWSVDEWRKLSKPTILREFARNMGIKHA